MKINQLKAGAALSYLSMGLSFIVSMIYTPIMLRVLGQSEYGLYNLVASVVSYLGLLSFGFGSTYVRFFSRYKVQEDQENIAKLNGMYLIIFTVIGFIAVIVGLVMASQSKLIFGNKIADEEHAKARVLLLILTFNISVSFPSTVFSSYVYAHEKFVFQRTIQIIQIIIQPFLVLPILLLGYGSIGMAAATTSLHLAFIIVNIIYCFRNLEINFGFHNFNFSLLREIAVFSSFIFLYMIIDQINWNIDKFVLGRERGMIEVAVYSIGAQFNSHFISISTAISAVFVPRINKIVASTNDNKELSNLFAKIGRIQYIIVFFVLLLFIVFGQPFVTLWAGQNYSISYVVAVLLMLPMVGALIQNTGIEIRKAKNLHIAPALFMFAIALLNVAISIPMARRFGAVGSTVGTSISLVINRIFMNAYYKKVVGLDTGYFWKHIWSLNKGAILPICLAVLIRLSYNFVSLLVYFMFALPLTFMYFFSMYKYGMNKSEKDIWLNVRQRIFTKRN